MTGPALMRGDVTPPPLCSSMYCNDTISLDRYCPSYFNLADKNAVT